MWWACTSFPLHGWGLDQALRCAKRRAMFALHSHFTHQIKDIWWNRHRCFQLLLCCVLNLGVALVVVMLLSVWQYQVHRPSMLAIWKASPVAALPLKMNIRSWDGCSYAASTWLGSSGQNDFVKNSSASTCWGCRRQKNLMQKGKHGLSH